MTNPLQRIKPQAWLLAAFCFITTFYIGWIAEDALIPLRVVKQFWAGNGLVWNPGERVQVCTSLLWQILILPTGLFPNTPLALLIFNCSLSAIFGLAIGQYAKSPWRIKP